MKDRILSRFWSRVDKNGPISKERPDLGPCWIWLGWNNGKGYGKFFVSMERPKVYVHRFAYEMEKGIIPHGLVVDHLCRNRACVRVSHMEVKTMLANLLAPNSRVWMNGANNRDKTSCSRGHEFTADNTYTHRGKRSCRKCRAENELRRQQTRKE